MNEDQRFIYLIRCTTIACASVACAVVCTIALGVYFANRRPVVSPVAAAAPQMAGLFSSPATKPLFMAPDTTAIPLNPEGDLVRYGRELVAHTSVYLGPKGRVMQISNGMNCQNCHLKAGKKTFGNSYGGVASTYPKLRARSGTVEDVVKRVNDCIERSLNGHALAADSREMKAFVSYITWVGKEVKADEVAGIGLIDLPPLDRRADPIRGKVVFDAQCTRCHGSNGEGVLADNGLEWIYPPLYGPNSYNVGAGLFRLSRFAAYAKANMPNGTSFDNPVLTDEEAWDVAAYVNSMPRPSKDLTADWPDIASKPFDHPFGPYADDFSEEQHKYGPFKPIRARKTK